jgi:chromosomal replication initiation ATPase DnaA
MTAAPQIGMEQPQAWRATDLETRRQLLISAAAEARRALRETRRTLSVLNNQERYEPAMHVIASKVAERTGVPVDRMRGPSRYRAYARARGDAMLAIREETGASYDLIGAFFGNRDHTTALTAVRQARFRRDMGAKR